MSPEVRIIAFALVAQVCMLTAPPAIGQSPDASIVVEGEVSKSLKLSVADLSALPVAEVKAKDKGGREHTFRGTPLSAILQLAGVTMGKDLHGKNLMKYVIVEAVDAYQVVYSLPEIDPDFTSHVVLLATHVDGKEMSKGEGPFRLINAFDKRPTRWVRDVKTIKVSMSR